MLTGFIRFKIFKFGMIPTLHPFLEVDHYPVGRTFSGSNLLLSFIPQPTAWLFINMTIVNMYCLTKVIRHVYSQKLQVSNPNTQSHKD